MKEITSGRCLEDKMHHKIIAYFFTLTIPQSNMTLLFLKYYG